MDPSKRICLKNLPEGCTKKEIADFVRNRTGSQPHSIDLGQIPGGTTTRRYSHFSIEGAKAAVQTLDGCALRGCQVKALPAHPHYSAKLAEGKRKREQMEEQEEAQRKAFAETVLKHFNDRTDNGDMTKARPQRDFYGARRKYANVASEIAKRFRDEHAKRKRGYSDPVSTGGASTGAAAVVNAEGVIVPGQQPQAVDRRQGHPQQKVRPDNRRRRRLDMRLAKEAAAKAGGGGGGGVASVASATPAAASQPKPAPVPEKPAPSKEERKLTGLQAKLAALREKMSKNRDAMKAS